MTDSDPVSTPPRKGLRPTPPERDIEEGKALAILSYALNFVGLPFWLVPLILRNNVFSLYHAKQCLMIWLAGLLGSVVASALVSLCGIGVLLIPIVWVGLIVFNVMGLINAVKGLCVPVPLIGVYAEKWFEGIRKV